MKQENEKKDRLEFDTSKLTGVKTIGIEAKFNLGANLRILETGLEKIAREREEQMVKHGRTIYYDVVNNTANQLSEAASLLAYDQTNCLHPMEIADDYCPTGWDKEIWSKMVHKPFEERLVIAGALIAAQLDVLSYRKVDYEKEAE